LLKEGCGTLAVQSNPKCSWERISAAVIGTEGVFLELGLDKEGSASLGRRLGADISFTLHSLSRLVVIAGIEGTVWLEETSWERERERGKSGRERNKYKWRLNKDKNNNRRRWEIHVCDLSIYNSMTAPRLELKEFGYRMV
jgi:hypothetical protein